MLLNSEYDVATDELNNQVDSINNVEGNRGGGFGSTD